ncbi:YdeI/OmpD-associated family protein [Tumebacillus sp. ITR2]|uniref:YdeI/OmpD-associated family protein n=1 Tax=Tumebacillus amylolyticus TaxID=2801339 RepID=A0ABS1J5A2_9BACL|nr:YdeI/OmpD-associated family protein [Tumebacillus amylolyticus]MBL0385204.1 YdeI/OmpD-associated family protein [Tumebacillus amylolyticus]
MAASDLAVKKLRLRPDAKAVVLNAPEGYLDLLGNLDGYDLRTDVDEPGTFEFVQVFVKSVAELAQWAPRAIQALNGPNAMFWIVYPKKSGKIKTDITRDVGWDVLDQAEYEGVALVSVDETWSSMRFRPQTMVDPNSMRNGKTRAERMAAMKQAVKDKPVGDRTVEVPEDFQAALNESAQAKDLFDNLAYSHRKEYVTWITSAKREETRTRRIAQAIEKLQEGKKRPSGV